MLRTLPTESIHMVITSPPYWNLRDYNVAGQIGLEPSYEEYISKLCEVFDEVKRILRSDGTCWINLADNYSGSGGGYPTKQHKKVDRFLCRIPATPRSDIPRKSLCLIPYRFAIEMVHRGWLLRNTIIWHKPNVVPESVKDRFTVDFEYLFFFTKSARYYFHQQREPSTQRGIKQHSALRNKRCIWSIPTRGFPDNHFATYPPALLETPIKAGCPEGGIVLDPFLGSGTTALVAERFGRQWCGIELNPDYVRLAARRISSQRGSCAHVLRKDICPSLVHRPSTCRAASLAPAGRTSTARKR